MSVIKYWQAVNLALSEETARDDRVIVFGEDAGSAGGAFGATRGLQERVGELRVRDTPISEATIIGAGVGAAMAGCRPVVEVMFFDFVTLAMDQLVNQAAKMHFMSGGGFSVPLTVRVLCGRGRGSGPQHSQSFEGWLANVPGLKVVWPSTPQDAYDLLRAAIRDEGPVVVVESLELWGERGEVVEGAPPEPLGAARTVVEGSDVTVVAWGGAVRRACAAAEQLRDSGISVEVIDLRGLSPLDEDAIGESAEKTGRVIVVHDAVGRFGPGAEVAAFVSERAFGSLKAPVTRLAPPFGPVPFAANLEAAFYPSSEAIVQQAQTLMDRG